MLCVQVSECFFEPKKRSNVYDVKKRRGGRSNVYKARTVTTTGENIVRIHAFVLSFLKVRATILIRVSRKVKME